MAEGEVTAINFIKGIQDLKRKSEELTQTLNAVLVGVNPSAAWNMGKTKIKEIAKLAESLEK